LLGVMDGTRDLPEDIPSNWCFFLGADVADPTGAAFNLSSLNQ
jgi:hypothetical protein